MAGVGRMSSESQPTPLDQGEPGSGVKDGPTWLIAALMTAVVLATAIAAWRTSDLSSKAGAAEREGLIKSVQDQSLRNEDWRLTLEQAANAQRYFAAEAEVDALVASGDEIDAAQAAALRQYLLPSLVLLAGPLLTDDRYLNPDGSLDLEQRYADVHAETLEADPPDAAGAFARADRLHNQQRWTVVGTVLLAGSLFWLALAEITRERTRSLALILGLAIFAVGMIWFVGVELVGFVAWMTGL